MGINVPVIFKDAAPTLNTLRLQSCNNICSIKVVLSLQQYTVKYYNQNALILLFNYKVNLIFVKFI
jgi:hypothetical protein